MENEEEPTVWFRSKPKVAETIKTFKKTEVNPLQAPYDELMKRFQIMSDRADSLEDQLLDLKEARIAELKDYYHKYELQNIIDTAYETVWMEVAEDIRNNEYDKIRLQLEKEARADIVKEVRQQIIADMAKASERI
jgi:hypothetical protein